MHLHDCKTCYEHSQQDSMDWAEGETRRWNRIESAEGDPQIGPTEF